MTFENLIQEPQHLLLKCISGSRAYNLSLPSSDTDLKGIFVLPREELYGLTYTPQVANASNDEVFFEIGRFIELLSKNNPNILELLSTPDSCVLFRHPLMNVIKAEDFLSKLCLDTFAGYAKTQIKKARGLNKKINRSFEKERKTVLDFCYIAVGAAAVPATDWLAGNNYHQEDCGLTGIAHFRDAYAIYHQAKSDFKGIVSGPTANDVQLSSIPKGVEALAILYFNKDAYSVYCKEYAEYWQWVEERNETRYQQTLSHGKNYDAKHMMHTFRLLNMAGEIAQYKKVLVHREDREFLLRIRNGEFEYDELIEMAHKKMADIEFLYAKSSLPEAPDPNMAERLLVHIRRTFYS